MARTKFYGSIHEMRSDLDAHLITYNAQRPHQGRDMNGTHLRMSSSAACPKPKEDKIEKPPSVPSQTTH